MIAANQVCFIIALTLTSIADKKRHWKKRKKEKKEKKRKVIVPAASFFTTSFFTIIILIIFSTWHNMDAKILTYVVFIQ